MTRHLMTRLGLAAAFGILLTLFAAPASAGVATAGAVLLDPYDPVPEIQFRHFGGYGCETGCGACDYCGSYASYGCYDDCRRHYVHRRHWRCENDCDRDCRDGCERADCGDRCGDRCDRDCNSRCDHDCDRHCDRDCDRGGTTANACQSERCYDAEHYERRWRDGNRVGQEWMDRGTRERTLPEGGHAGGYYDAEPGWRGDEEDNGPPPPPPPHDDHGDHGDHHDGDHHGH